MYTNSSTDNSSTWSSELHYSLNHDDVMRMQSLAIKRLRSSIPWIQLHGLPILAIALISWSVFSFLIATLEMNLPNHKGWAVVVCLAIGISCLLLVNPITYKTIFQYMFTRDGWMLGQRRLVISEKSIQTWQSNSHSTVSMNEVKFVMRDDHNHYLMMEPAVGFIIPNSALETASNNAELKQFLASRIAP